MPRILVVEDEEHLAAGIRFNLELDGYEVETIGDGLRAIERLAPEAPDLQTGPPVDLVLLDVMLPGLDGFQIVERMRLAGNFAPVLMLTAKGLPEDVVHGLETGADDYLAKPFEPDELLARLRALARREPSPLAPVLRLGDLALDPATRDVQRAGEPIALSPREYALLEYLLRNPHRVVSRTRLMEHVWDDNFDPVGNAVEVLVSRVRRKVDGPGLPPLFQTVRGAGYMLTDRRPVHGA